MKETIINNGYTIFASDVNLLKELEISDCTINWNNFNVSDDYYSDNNIQYKVLVINHEDKYVVLD